MVDSSIAQAYVQIIRNAEKFIYIENQYLMGSSCNWLDQNYANTSCNNMIPKAIVERIKISIDNNEPFTVYILLPLFPEGDPTSMATQEIIFWQNQTLRYMNSAVGKHLKKHLKQISAT